MAAAFCKEEEAQWLHQIPGTIPALKNYCTKDAGYKVVERKTFFNPKIKREVTEMSNGLSYALDKNNSWEIVW